MFEKLKKILGFGAPDIEENGMNDDPVISTSTTSPFLEENSSTGDSSVSMDETTAEIFEHVVARFNSALPDFLQRSVDPEKEKKALYDALSDDIKAHLKGLENQVNDRLNASWRSEREKLQADLKAASKSAKDIETKRNELKSQQLSSERQKRAMTERIHDLEKQLLASEAEREQIELENKSMLNKVKVAGVYEKEMEEMRQLIESLQEELKNAKQTQASADGDVTAPSETESNADLLAHIELLEQDREQNLKRIEELVQKEKEYNELVDKMSIIEEQISKFEKFAKAKDEKIESLKAQLAQQTKSENTSLADAEKLKAEIEKLKTQNEQLKAEIDSISVQETNSTSDNETISEAISLPDVDDILTDTEWVVQPPPPRISKSQPRNEKGRSKKQNLEDGQMSLW